jgi:hypothetical protein
MALKLSTGLRNKLLGLVASPKAFLTNAIAVGTLTYVDGGGSADSITDSASGFIAAGFAPGDVIYTFGSTQPLNDISAGVVLISVVAGTITFATGTVNTGQAFEAGTVLICCKGGSIKDVFKDGVLRIYSGAQPASPDAAISGTLLLEVSESSGAFVAGAFDNGLELGDAALGIIAKAAGETWQDAGLAAGTAGYFRLVANATDNGGADTALPRVDGSVGTSGADLNMSSTSISVGSTYTIDTFQLTLPEYYGA